MGEIQLLLMGADIQLYKVEWALALVVAMAAQQRAGGTAELHTWKWLRWQAL